MSGNRIETASENTHQLTGSISLKIIYCSAFVNNKLTFLVQFFEP